MQIKQHDKHREWAELTDGCYLLHTVGRPEQHLAILLQKLGLPLPNEPKSI